MADKLLLSLYELEISKSYEATKSIFLESEISRIFSVAVEVEVSEEAVDVAIEEEVGKES